MDYEHFTYETFRPVDSSPTGYFTYGRHKNTYPAIHTAVVSITIMQSLVYLV